MIIDSHQHFWNYDSDRHAWIDDQMSVLKRDFTPEDLKTVFEAEGVKGCVAVQADQSEGESDFLLGLADEYDFIQGVVGWVDLRAEDVSDRLAHYTQYKKMRGFRHVVQSEPDPEFMLRPDFARGLSHLHAFGYTYDILIFPTQLSAAIRTVRDFPLQPFVLDHIAKPYIKAGKIEAWKQGIRELAASENTWCKISGMITEADWENWSHEDLLPYLDVIFESFGMDRVMYGSDWPVCLLAGSYSRVKQVLIDYLGDPECKAPVWGQNAVRFYSL